MAGKIHPYYEAVQRIVAAHADRWTISSLAAEAGLDMATIRVAIRDGSAPSVRTVEKLQAVLGLDYDGVMNWNGEPIDDGEKVNDLRELGRLGAKVSQEDRRFLLEMARKLAREPQQEEGDDGED